MIVHQQTGTSHGVKETRCGLTGKTIQASGWQSDVSCPQCLNPTPEKKP